VACSLGAIHSVQTMTKATRKKVMMRWCSIGASLLRKSKPLVQSSFKSYFKLDTYLVEVLYRRILKRFVVDERDLLWTLFFLKSRDPDHMKIALALKTDRTGLHRVVKSVMNKILAVSPKV
jgi:hypothetical protein